MIFRMDFVKNLLQDFNVFGRGLAYIYNNDPYLSRQWKKGDEMMALKMPVIKRLFCVAVLLVTVLAFLPIQAVWAEGPGFTPKEQAKADRWKEQYQKLRSDMYGLNDLFDKAASNRQSYAGFLSGEQYAKHNTAMLEQNLAIFDSYVNEAHKWQNKGFDDLAYPNGFDSSGQNVVNINVVSSEVLAALPDYLTSRSYITRAIYVLHSALNLYHQRSVNQFLPNGLAVPDIPKYRPPLYCIACPPVAE